MTQQVRAQHGEYMKPARKQYIKPATEMYTSDHRIPNSDLLPQFTSLEPLGFLFINALNQRQIFLSPLQHNKERWQETSQQFKQ